MSMSGDRLAAEAIQAMGGKVTPARLKAFRALCGAIVKHIQTNMTVASSGTDPQGGFVTSQSTTVQ